MAYKWPNKDPQAVKDYGLDWSAWLAVGDTISTSLWTVSDPSLTINAFPSSILGGVTTVWLSAGTEGMVYSLVNHIKTSLNREDDRTVTVKVVTQ